MKVERLRQEAWIGDAVLELYARQRVLSEMDRRDFASKSRFVRNAFLSQLGQPTRVEAEIGRQYADGGLETAFAWITEHLQPLFLKQEANRAASASQQISRKKRRPGRR